MLLHTFNYRIKDSSGVAWLDQATRSVSYVWNYCRKTAAHALSREGEWLSGFELQKLTAGTSKELKLSSTSIQAVCEEYASKRNQFKLKKLKKRGRKEL